jgi:hypothetical protein
VKGYTATYKPETIAGEPGWSYQCFCDERLVFEGWSRGAKRDAEAEVRNGIRNRNHLLGAFAGVPLAVS